MIESLTENFCSEDKALKELMNETGYLPEEKNLFYRNFTRLSEEGRVTLILRYGLFNTKPHSYREIAAKIGDRPGSSHFIVKRSVSYLKKLKISTTYNKSEGSEKLHSRIIYKAEIPELGDRNDIRSLGLSRKLHTRLLLMGVKTVGESREALAILPKKKKHYAELRACLRNFDKRNGKNEKENVHETPSGVC